MKGMFAALGVLLACAAARAQPAGSGSGSGKPAAAAAEEENELPADLAPKPTGANSDATPAPATPAPAIPPPAATPGPVTPPAPAADDPRTKAEARKLIDGGDTFLKKGDYLEKHGKHDQAVEQYQRALAAYQKAYDLVPNAQIYYAIAGAEQKLGHWLVAATDYKKMLAEATDLKPALKDAATAQIETIKQYLGQVTLTVTPDGTHVTVDGKDFGTAPLGEPLLLEPGEYTLGFTRDGYTPTEQKIKLEAGSESERTFALQPIPVVVDKPKEPPPVAAPPERASKLPLYIGAGATGAFTLSAVITGIVAVKKHSTFERASASEAERDSARTSGKHYALGCDLSMAGALVGAGFTVYWYLKEYEPKERELEKAPAGAAPEAAVWVMPVVSADGGGMAVGGTF